MVEPYRTGRPLGKNCTFWDVEDAGKLHPDAYGTGMASEGLERHLHETDRRVALGEEQILRQRAIIVDLEARGDDATLV
jgi:hypothetical protein